MKIVSLFRIVLQLSQNSITFALQLAQFKFCYFPPKKSFERKTFNSVVGVFFPIPDFSQDAKSSSL